MLSSLHLSQSIFSLWCGIFLFALWVWVLWVHCNCLAWTDAQKKFAFLDWCGFIECVKSSTSCIFNNTLNIKIYSLFWRKGRLLFLMPKAKQFWGTQDHANPLQVLPQLNDMKWGRKNCNNAFLSEGSHVMWKYKISLPIKLLH